MKQSTEDVYSFELHSLLQILFIMVSNQLNCLYLKFIKRNPGYDGKVSIYGHSLGSVLSYDILCHQENLSSPFPMDWMYKEHDRSDQSSLDIKNQPSVIDFPTNQEGDKSSVLDGTMENVDPVHKECPDGHASKFSTIKNQLVDLGQLPAVVMEAKAKQRSDEKGDHELGSDSSDRLTQERGQSVEASEVKCDDHINGFEKMVAEGHNDTSNKDEAIKFLREEIDSLKAKIAELESQCDSKDTSDGMHQVNVATTTKQPICENLPSGSDDTPKSYTPYIRYTKLEFKVDTFFAVGSPLGVFLALRNVRIGIGKGQEYWREENINEEMPACRQMFNIFHPFDPVAYRVEPLVCKEYTTKRPVIIPYHKGGRRLHIGFQEFVEDLAARSQAITDHLNFIKVKVLTVCQSKSIDGIEEGVENVQGKEERSYGSLMMERLTGTEGRIDHMLQAKTFEHPYLQAIGSHTNYWRDCDTSLFILKHLYKDIPEDADLPEGSSEHNSKDESTSARWTDRREIKEEEELPLTFSDRMMVKNFSRKAKKHMKKT